MAQTKQRRADGRFLPGNRYGVGRKSPHAPHVAKLVQAARKAVKPEQIVKIIEKLVELALDGDSRAAQIVLDRCLGKVKDTVEIQGDAKMLDLQATLLEGLKQLRLRGGVDLNA